MIEITRSIDGEMNTRKWGSKREDVQVEQHQANKKWYFHEGLKRTKLRWNKKKGKLELSKKGSRDAIYWCD